LIHISRKDCPARSKRPMTPTSLRALSMAFCSLLCLGLPAQDKPPKPTAQAVAVTEAMLVEAITKLEGIKECTYPPEKKDKSGFEDADYFSSEGKLQPNREREPELKKWVNCSTFATPVIHQLCKGTLGGFKPSAPWVRGDGKDIADHFGLKGLNISVGDLRKLLDPQPAKETTPKGKGLDEKERAVIVAANAAEAKRAADDKAAALAWCKANAGVYFFDLDHKHVGFLVVRDDGTSRHVQFSMDQGKGPMDNGKFAAYLAKHTKFKSVDLYRIVRAPS
jgi:hypothetical protein